MPPKPTTPHHNSRTHNRRYSKPLVAAEKRVVIPRAKRQGSKPYGTPEPAVKQSIEDRTKRAAKFKDDLIPPLSQVKMDFHNALEKTVQSALFLISAVNYCLELELIENEAGRHKLREACERFQESLVGK
jgi:hypothetical protein